MQKIVFTGGLSVGKTTTLEILKTRGYNVLFEVSAGLIAEHQDVHGINSFPLDRDAFQDTCVAKQLEAEENLQGDLVFLDRCIVDEIPFYINDGRNVPNDLWELARHHRYSMVFCFEELEQYEQAAHRPQSPEVAQRIQTILPAVFEYLDYNLIQVPAMSTEERVDFILGHCNR